MSVHEALASLLSNFPASTTTAYQDTFANADIRLAPTFKNVDFYYKKSLFVETSEYLRPTFGHTNLTEYYGKLYSLADEMTDWQVPETALPKLRLAPNFLTNPELLDAILEKPERLSQTERNIDIHARLGGTKQEGWYGEMRRQAEKSMSGLRNLNITSGQGVSRQAFAEEMSRSKVCFSPFGFGELCWRDIEAIAAGAVLLKPNMSHLRTEPDLYQDGKTYVACRWDFADLQERVEYLLSNPALRQNLADQAWEIAYDYLTSGGPVSAYSDMFAPHSKAGDVR